METRPRPSVGDTTTTEKHYDICRMCGGIIDEFDACAYGCIYDGELKTRREYFVAVYRVTSEFLGDRLP